MQWYVNLATRTKLFLGFGLITVLFAVVVVTAYFGITEIQTSQKSIIENEFQVLEDLKTVRTNQNAQRAALMIMLVTKGSQMETWHNEVKQRAADNVKIMRSLMERQKEQSPLLSKLRELEALRIEFSDERDKHIIPLIFEGKIEEAKKAVLGPHEDLNQKQRTIANELVDEIDRMTQHALSESDKTATRSVSIFLIVGFFAILVSVLIALSLNRIIANPLKELAVLAERIAGGDLTVEVRTNGRLDEVGGLSQAFNKMVENLRDVSRETREVVNVLAGAAGEILTATTQIAQGASSTATAVSQTTTTVEEVKQTAQVASQKSSNVADVAQKTAQTSHDGSKAVQESIEGMSRIREQMESIAETIVRLSEQTQAIAEITATVNDLAEQSNLLAVNASIEAAKAGEQGRGFAVVAQEVKSLAEQSKQATAQVRAILGDIQKATSAAVMATEQGSKAVEGGVKQSAQAGESIKRLAEGITEASQAATQIAVSSQQQLVGMDQIAGAMESVKAASAQNAAGTKQVEKSAEDLHKLGQKLRSLMDQYKL